MKSILCNPVILSKKKSEQDRVNSMVRELLTVEHHGISVMK